MFGYALFKLLFFEYEANMFVFKQILEVNAEMRIAQMGQVPRVYWLTGLPCSGKSTIANTLDLILYKKGIHTCLLDGDNVRLGLNSDLGFTPADRRENVRRLAEVARLMADAGLLVIVAAVSPSRLHRDMVRTIVGSERFVEIFINTPLEVCEARDVKGLYRRARQGEVTGFTGVDSPYEPPVAAELVVDTVSESAANAAVRIAQHYMKVCGGSNSCQ